MTATFTEITEQTAPPQTKLSDGDHERFSHIVIGGTGAIIEAMVTGVPCTALCGKTWVPSRDPKKFPLCPTCKEEADRLGWKVPTG